MTEPLDLARVRRDMAANQYPHEEDCLTLIAELEQCRAERRTAERRVSLGATRAGREAVAFAQAHAANWEAVANEALARAQRAERTIARVEVMLSTGFGTYTHTEIRAALRGES